MWVISLADTVNPGTADYLRRGLADAQAADACLVVIRLDTPGGLVESMRQMTQAIIASPQPVAVFVAPGGARATSAGAFLVLASDVAAMAPGTHLGAAHPVGGGGEEIKGVMGEKAVSDLAALAESLAKRRGRDPAPARAMVEKSTSYDADQARKLGIVDLVTADLGGLLKALEGREVATAAGPRRVTTAGRALKLVEPGWREGLLSTLANPNLAYVLLMIGLAGIYFELSHPGTMLPGVVGGICLILAFFSMSALPVSYAGLALIGLSVVLFFAEIKITSYGMLSLGGAAALILGSLMLFETDDQLLKVSLAVLAPTALLVIAFFGSVAWLAGRAQFRKSITGAEGLVGQVGRVRTDGRVLVAGELWRAASEGPLRPGQEVRVVKLEPGLVIRVDPVDPGAGAQAPAEKGGE